MQEYDVTLKLLLQGSAKLALLELTGAAIEKLLDIELQSSNDPIMPLRMAEYGLGTYRFLHRFPRQILLYVGDEPLGRPCELMEKRFGKLPEWAEENLAARNTIELERLGVSVLDAPASRTCCR